MNRLLTLSLSLTLLLSLSAFAQPKEADTNKRGPVFQLVGGLYQDLGTVPAEKMRRTVYITNIGDDTLRILRTMAGDPILPVLKDSLIPPGDTVGVELLGPFDGSGPKELTKSVGIITNDPNNPDVRFQIHLRVVPDIMLHLPGDNHRSLAYLLIPLKPGHDTTITVTLEVTGDSAFVVSPASMSIRDAGEKRSDIAFSSNMTKDVRLEPGQKLDVALWFVMAGGSKEKEGQPYPPITLNVSFPIAGRSEPIDCSVIITYQ